MTRYEPGDKLVPPGKTRRFVLPGSRRTQPVKSMLLEVVFASSTQSGPLSADVRISLIRAMGSAGRELARPGEPFSSSLACQLAGLDGPPNGSVISREKP